MAFFFLLRQRAAVVAVVLIALALAAYAYAQSVMSEGIFKGPLSRHADASVCPALSQPATDNPNKTQFVSCGGFFD